MKICYIKHRNCKTFIPQTWSWSNYIIYRVFLKQMAVF